MIFKLFDIVSPLEDIKDSGIQAGEVGTVVEILHNPDAYYVEFANKDGETLAFVPLLESQISAPELRKAA
ncbi:MAG: DUF4926 domain-containing protein [Sulfuricellaceae bacterium]|nr:DUF4926 domain-containing protein [Sulfuricellaceae bacterium]